jgi:hypothetical protein
MADVFDSPTVPWGADTTVHAKEPGMTGAEFHAIRDKHVALRAGIVNGVQQSPVEMISRALGPGCGLPRAAAVELAKYIASFQEKITRLEGQVETLQQQLAQQNPPHLAKHERRTA